MKLKFKIAVLLLTVVRISAYADEYQKKVHQGYIKSQITALDISNKFGKIEINDLGGDSVTVDAVVTIENVSENKADQLFNRININIKKSGGLINAETVITDDFKTKGNFSIDYRINIPKDRDLTVNNKFGNVILNDLEGKGRFEIAYGNLTAGTLNAPENTEIMLDLAYGKADIESVNRLNGEIKYSKLFIGTAEKMKINSKYSGLDVDKMADLQLESKYDGVRIEEISRISAISKYTNYTIDKLLKDLVIDTEYGSVRVNEVSPDFGSIEITNSYGGITIGLNEKAYNLDADCDYCDIKYPADHFAGNRIKDDHRLQVKGSIGTNAGSRKVVIRSRYGGINLTK